MAIALHKDQKMAAHWKTQIEQCDKATDKWRKRAEKISKNYRDERDDSDKGAAKRLNLFWSNVQTLKPAIYAKAPVPICERRFLDKDTTGRVASTILERALRYEVSMCGFSSAVRRCLDDYLIPGRGQVWVRYVPKFGDPISPEQTAEDDIQTQGGEVVDEDRDEAVAEETREFLSESLCVDYVHWQDWYYFPASARTWQEVEGVGRKLYMSRTDMKEARFEAWDAIPLDHAPTDDSKSRTSQGAVSLLSGQEGMQATVFEIWWKPARKVYFVAKEYDKLCKEQDDPLKLEGFFPCPEPLSATMTNDTMIPVPDYAESQDQYIQIDDLTKRIDILVAACKIVGVYDSAAQSLKRVFEEAVEPNLIPVDSWAMFAEKGGLKGAIDWVPIEQVAKVIDILIGVRKQIIEDLDRTTGIPDIMRGTSDARETMGGQRLKANNSATRLQDRQDEMARFCRDIICIMGEIISEHYDPQTLVQVSGALYDEGLDPPALAPQIANAMPVPPQMGHNGGPALEMSPASPMATPQPGMPMGSPVPAGAPQQPAVPSAAMPQETPEQKMQRKDAMIANAIALLRQDKLRGFRIDIETDSTIQGDAQQEKEARVEFLKGVTDFVEKAAQVTAITPEFAPLAAKMLQFGVRGFRVGRDLEAAIEDFCDKVEMDAKAAAANPNKAPSPEQIKADSERYKADKEVERQQLENAGEERNAMIDLQSKQLDLRMKEIELEMKRIEFHTRMSEGSGEGMDDEGNPKSVGIHPHMVLHQIGEAAKVIDMAAKRMSAPKRIVRDPTTGKAHSIETDFQEQ